MLVERNVLVTGAAGTMGLAVTKAFISKGYRVVMVDLKKEKLQSIAEELGENAVPYVLNIIDTTPIGKMVEDISKSYGAINILVNNAGILSNNKLESTDFLEWNKVIEINFSSMFYLCQAIVPVMKKQGWGRIINVSSLAAKSGGITAGTAYSASKGGVVSLTFSLARELAPFGITVNTISPAYIKTPMVTEQLTDEERAMVVQQIPVSRYCEPEEFAHVVCFLADDLSGFITGENIDINGGLLFD